jgi:hypothetical protein
MVHVVRKFALLLFLASPCWAQVLQHQNGGTDVSSPGSLHNCLVSDGTNWTSGACPGGGSSPYYVVPGSYPYTVLGTAFSQPAPACGEIHANGSAGTITLPISTSQPAAGQCVIITDFNAIITVAPNGQTLSWASSSGNFLMYPGTGIRITSDGTNYQGTPFTFPWGDSALFGQGTYGGNGSASRTSFVGSSIANTSFDGKNNAAIGSAMLGSLRHGQSNVLGCYNCAGGLRDGSWNVIAGYGAGFNNLQDNNSSLLLGGDGTYQCDTPDGTYNNYVCIFGLMFGDHAKGIVIWKGPPTTIGTCGSSPSLATGSNDTVGEGTVGSSSSNSCKVSFANTHSVAPFCLLSNQAGEPALSYSITTSALTVTAASGLDGTKFDYHCFAGVNSGTPTP